MDQEHRSAPDGICYDYLRPQKAALSRKWHQWCQVTGEPLQKREPGSQALAGATILPLRREPSSGLLFGRGGVLNAEGGYISASAIERRVDGGYQADAVRIIHQRVVYCGYLVRHWGHFLVEGAARLWYFAQNDSDAIDRYVFFVDEGGDLTVSGNYREFLELLGVWDKVLVVNEPTAFDQVIVPELGYKWRDYYSDAYKGVFDVIRARACQKKNRSETQPRRLFLTRSALPGSREIDAGVEMLDDYFTRNGYAIVSPERISLSDLIVMLDGAEEVAASSGTLPHHLLFARDGQRALIMERNVLINEIQCDIDVLKALRVTYVDANLSLYPVNVSSGPFILYYGEHFRRYTEDHHLLPPSDQYLAKRWRRGLFNRYMSAYSAAYGREWFFLDWYAPFVGLLREAYQESAQVFAGYLNGPGSIRLFDRMLCVYIRKAASRVRARLRRSGRRGEARA